MVKLASDRAVAIAVEEVEKIVEEEKAGLGEVAAVVALTNAARTIKVLSREYFCKHDFSEDVPPLLLPSKQA